MPTQLMIVTQWFDPEPTSKGLRFAQELSRRGFQVEVVTGFPNYPEGKLYPGYRIRLLDQRWIGGILVSRVPLFPSHGASKIGRVLNYLSFAISAGLYGIFKAQRPDVIYAYHPPLTVAIAAALIRILRRARLVCDIQDLWPDTLCATGMVRNRLALWLVGVCCKLVYRSASHLVVLSPGFRQRLMDRGISDSKIQVIYNWSDERMGADGADAASELDIRGSFSFALLFAGNLGLAQGLDAVLDAAELLQRQDRDVRFVFLGDGLQKEELRRQSRERLLRNVVFLPRVPMSEVGAYLQAADSLLVHLRRDPLFSITIPSKTQAYIRTGKPIVMAVPGDAARLIEQAGCGVIADSENPASIAAAVTQLLGMSLEEREIMGKRGKDFYAARLSFARGVDAFAQILNSAVL